MARAYHVDGPVLILAGTGSGSPAALEEVGVCEDGVDIAVNFYMEAVRSDAAGPRAPADMQDFGSDATIRGRMVDYDLAILQKLRALAMGDTTEGEAGSPGRLMGSTSGAAYRLVLRNSSGEIWRFITCTIRGPHTLKLSSRYTAPQVEWYAWRFVPAGTNTASGIKLYDHTDA